MTAFQSVSAKGFKAEKQDLFNALVCVSLSISIKILFSTLATFCTLPTPLIPENFSKKREIWRVKVLYEWVPGRPFNLLRLQFRDLHRTVMFKQNNYPFFFGGGGMSEFFLTIKIFIFHKDFPFILLSSEKDPPKLANRKSIGTWEAAFGLVSLSFGRQRLKGREI